MAGRPSFCMACGGSVRPQDDFCTRCGVSVGATGQDPDGQPTAAGERASARAGSLASTLSVAGAAFGATTALGGLGLALPWHTAFGSGPVDVSGLIARTAFPAAQRAAHASLRRPALAVALTALMDLIATLFMGGVGALPAALPRLVLSAATVTLSLITGSSGGTMRVATGILSLVTGLVQLAFAGWGLARGLGEGASFISALPPVVAMLSSLAMTVKTGVVALRR